MSPTFTRIKRRQECTPDRLPAVEIAGALNASLGFVESAGTSTGPVNAVVTAPPGAGKSTLLPLTLLEAMDACGACGRILMLEPRRVAARQIAERMAWLLDEPVGQTVGYRTRFDTKVSAGTRIEVLTEGILNRIIANDPTLDGTAVVIFDEFHERSLACDQAFALTKETQRIIRPDLGIVVMSATMDAEPVCRALDAVLIESKGRSFPIDIIHSGKDYDAADCPLEVARAVASAAGKHDGDILAFLPGEAEIRRCAELLEGRVEATVFPLYGMLGQAEQRRAMEPGCPGGRKIVLATPVAETSITIEGITVVVDSGLCKTMVFDPQNGLSHLETVRISRDRADQRSGRAGRTAPGVCYRLWSTAAEARMAGNRTPEILEADLAPTLLDIALWGGTPASELPWLTPPPSAHLASAEAVLKDLGALDRSGLVTAHGRRIAALPCHPRMAQMLVKARTPEERALAADIAAILEEKDRLSVETDGADIDLRISALRRARSGGDRRWSRIIQTAAQYRSIIGAPEDNSPDLRQSGRLLAEAYPNRIARAGQDGPGRYILASGESATLGDGDSLTASEWLVAASLNAAKGRTGRIFLAAGINAEELEDLAVPYENIGWDSRKGTVVAQEELRIGRLVVKSRPIHDIPREKCIGMICGAAAKEGLSMFDFNDEVGNLQRRVAAVASWHPELDLPDLSTEAVLARATDWLPLFIGKAASVAELKRIDLKAALWSLLDYGQQKEVERLAPSHIKVPTGSSIAVEYRTGAEAPVLRVRLQECFGMTDTPTVDGGRRPVLMELLSPGFKPVQLTTDLHSFWENTYFEVRKELRMRYPKHSWPDNPLEAEAVRGVRRKDK